MSTVDQMATIDQVDPSEARSAAEYVQAMRRLRASAGQPSLRELSRKANANTAGSLPVSTLSDALRKDRLPPWRVVDAFLTVCGVSPRHVARWRTTWERLAVPNGQAGDPGAQASVKPAIEPAKVDRVPRKARRRSGDQQQAHPMQEDAEAEELVAWLRRTLIQPKKCIGEERRGIFKLNRLSRINPYVCSQLRRAAYLKSGEDIGCHAEHPLLEYTTLYYCFTQDDDADMLVGAKLPELFWATIKCLGELRVIENDTLMWNGDEEGERGVSYDTAFLLSNISEPGSPE
jgi:hypothetical protein